MFSNTRSKQGEGRDLVKPKSGPPAPSIISVDMRVSGDLETDGDVQIDGTVEGDVRSTSLTVGQTAQISGEIRANSVSIWGRVSGTIYAKEAILHETAVVVGDIVHQTVEISKGASIEGNLRRGEERDGGLPSSPRKAAPMVSLIAPESELGS